MTTFKPETDAQVIEAVRWAVAESQPLSIQGRGTKAALGRPVQAAHTLDLSALSGIVSYEPEELMLVVKPGTSMAEVEETLRGRGQELAFEAPDYGPLFGTGTNEGTIGGLISAGLSGPRRVKWGAARDHILATSAVSGRGELFKAGAKVVKNVTGYDLPKLLTGAFGTLGVLTEITLKVLPAAEVTRTCVLAGITAADAVKAMSDALGSGAEVSGAAWVPAELAFPGLPPRTPCALLRLEGPEVSVAARLTLLEGLLAGRAAMAVLDVMESHALWAALRDATPFAERQELVVWKLSVPPMEGAAVLDRVRQAVPGAVGWLDWGGGLIWIGLPEGEAAEAAVRGAILPPGRFSGGGHATLIRAPEPVRAGIPVFHPQSAAVAALSARIKQQFDTQGVLNPGRMVAGV